MNWIGILTVALGCIYLACLVAGLAIANSLAVKTVLDRHSDRSE